MTTGQKIILRMSDYPKQRIQSFLAVHLPGRLAAYLPVAREQRQAFNRIPAALSTCRKCRERIKLIGGVWTAPDGLGLSNCMADTSAAWAPHEPEEG
jgi:hypothetical protein